MLQTFIALAAVITAHPLVDGDVLEPSVQNEVDHALSRVPTNRVPVNLPCISFASLYATNGMDATGRAIDIVSRQSRTGQWFFEGGEVTPVAAVLLARASGADCAAQTNSLEVTCGQVRELSRLWKVPYKDAAARVSGTGVFSVKCVRSSAVERRR